MWVYTRSNGGWSQQGNKLFPNDATTLTGEGFGFSVALSSDGNTALIGGPGDSPVGSAWVFTRSGGVWLQQGSKLVGSGASGISPQQGHAVALSSDGNTALISGWNDNNFGAVWVFTRSSATWAQQGSKLTGSGSDGFPAQGSSVALSADGNTALIGGLFDNFGAGATWVFMRSGAAWTQLGKKLVGTGALGTAEQGTSLALSGGGDTALVGGPYDNSGIGAVWVFTLSEGIWSQQGSKLIGSGYSGQAQEGLAIALSSDGNTALFGGPTDDTYSGAAWVFKRSGGIWTQQGKKLVGSGFTRGAEEGSSVALSSSGDTAILGGPLDNRSLGAAWVFAVPTLSVSAPASADVGGPFDITVTAQDAAGATVTGYTDPVHFTSADSSATLPADSTLANGTGQFPVTLFTPGNQTITATDTVYTNVTGTSGPVSVPGLPPRVSKAFGAPTIPLNSSARLRFIVKNPNTASALSSVGFIDPLPAGLVVASPNGLSGACGGGTIRAVAGGGKVSLSGAALAANSSCSFSVKVTGTTAGTKNNVTSAVIAKESGKGNKARATLIVVAPARHGE